MKTINSYKFQILSLFAVLILVYAVYYRCTGFGFVFMDDDALIANKIGDMGSLAKAKDIFTKPVFDTSTDKFYRPILNLSFLIDTLISGGNAGFYHYTNVLLHAVNAFLILLVFGMLGYSKKVSLIISLIFAVHPALVSAVAWLPGRNDTLLAFFTLFSFIFFMQNLKTHKNFYLLLSSFAFTAALFTKETAVVVPVIYLLYIFLYEAKPDKKKRIKMLILAVIPIIFYFVSRYFVLSGSSSVLSINELIVNLFSSLKITFWYAGVLFLTEKAILYPHTIGDSVRILSGAIPMAVLISVCFVFRKRINFKALLFGVLWFVIFLFPTYVMPSNNFYIHRLYLPALGFFIAVAELILPILRVYPASKKFFYALSIVTVALFAAISADRSDFYKDRASFWLGALEENPGSVRVNAGVSRYYASIYETDKAEAYMITALRLAKGKDIPRMYIQAGLFYMTKGDAASSEFFLRKGLENSKYAVNAYLCLSRLYALENKKEDAYKIIEDGLALMPNDKALLKARQMIDGDSTGYSSNVHVSGN